LTEFLKIGVLETLDRKKELNFSKVFANTTISSCKSCFQTRKIENWKTQLHWMLQSTACFSSVTQTCSLPTNFLIIDIYNWVRVGKAGLAGQQPS